VAGVTIRLAIVDDHPMVTGGLAAALATIDDLIVVDRGQTFDEARALLVRDDIDVVLLDVRLEGGNGIQALAERGRRERPAVLVISSFRTSQYVAASARYGAAGFLLKTVPLPALIDAIRAAAAHLVDAGAVLEGPAALTPWGDRNARVRAPDGMQLTLFTPTRAGAD
jgi:DNA-binding NarL/FixJ family response regulator